MVASVTPVISVHFAVTFSENNQVTLDQAMTSAGDLTNSYSCRFPLADQCLLPNKKSASAPHQSNLLCWRYHHKYGDWKQVLHFT